LRPKAATVRAKGLADMDVSRKELPKVAGNLMNGKLTSNVVARKVSVETQLDVTELPAGTYLVRIDDGESFRWIKR